MRHPPGVNPCLLVAPVELPGGIDGVPGAALESLSVLPPRIDFVLAAGRAGGIWIHIFGDPGTDAWHLLWHGDVAAPRLQSLSNHFVDHGREFTDK